MTRKQAMQLTHHTHSCCISSAQQINSRLLLTVHKNHHITYVHAPMTVPTDSANAALDKCPHGKGARCVCL